MKKLLVLGVLFFAFAKAYSQEKESTKDIIFYYDVSYSMRDRDIQAEVDYLNTYFENYPDATVTLSLLSTSLNDVTEYKVRNGDWSSLKEAIMAIEFDGASDFSLIDFTQNADEFILATDGERSISKLPSGGEMPLTIINSVGKDTGELRWLADSSGGSYREVGDDGTSRSKSPPAEVKRVSETRRTSSNTTSESELDAVTITDYSNDTDREEYNTINVGGVAYDKKKLGYSVEKITDKEISQMDTDVKQAVSGQFAGIKVANNTTVTRTDLSQFRGRHDNMSLLGDQTGLIVIDGVPQAKANSAGGRGSLYDIDNNFRKGNTAGINPDNIESITLLKGLAATNRYGSLGKGGVIEIVTKSAGGSSKTKKRKKALGTTPTYTGAADLMSKLPDTPYLSKLNTATTLNEALDIYLKLRDRYGNDPYYFINVARYFKGWDKPEITSRILSNVTEVANNDIPTLRSLSYVYEEVGDYKAQVALAEHILELDDRKAQSYLDVARAYKLAGDYDSALNYYNKIILPQGLEGVVFDGIRDSAIKEYKSFVVSAGQNIKMNKVLPEYRKAPEKQARRILIEYSNPEALFDLKVINPQNRFFTWSHTTTAEPDRLIQEKKQGFNQEEFFLTDTDQGQWRFNVVNYGTTDDQSQKSTFLKITVFKDWGSPRQTREVMIVQLSDLNKENQVLSLNI